ncbi:hypothetical protein QE152_g167 [Popillia japonica]|uniref:Uncharacterized protein n=1 Tax=Popillia japonica TaxID=7064 RepID=A0AAW1NKG5_POPJA
MMNAPLLERSAASAQNAEEERGMDRSAPSTNFHHQNNYVAMLTSEMRICAGVAVVAPSPSNNVPIAGIHGDRLRICAGVAVVAPSPSNNVPIAGIHGDRLRADCASTEAASSRHST